MATKKTIKKKPEFKELVYKKLGKKLQSSVDIAIKLGLVDATGGATAHGAAKTRKALQELAAEERAVNEGAFKTSKYRLP
jgi:hypothetical protein